MGKPGSPWQGGPCPAGPPGCSALSSWVLDAPAPHLPLCGVGRIVPSGHRGLTWEGSPLPWVVGARGTPQDAAQRGCPGKCVCSPALDTAHTFLCSHTQAHMCTRVRMHSCVCSAVCLCICMPCTRMHTRARVHVITRVHTHAHSTRTCMGLFTCTCTLVCSHTLLCTRPTHTPARAALHAHTHLTAWTLISHLHTSHVHTDTCSGTWPHPSLPSTGPARTL